MVKVRAEEFTLMTNDAVDFRRLFRYEVIHPGLVILIPNATPPVQRALFSAALDFIGDLRPSEPGHRSRVEGRDIDDKRVRDRVVCQFPNCRRLVRNRRNIRV